MVKIRLRRVGAKKQPSYRMVVADSRSPRDGRFIEVVGFYNPRTAPETVTVQEGRVFHWLGVGAQPTESVAHLLNKQGTMARYERYKKGEPLEGLMAEAEAAAQAMAKMSPKTRREGARPVAEVPAATPVAEVPAATPGEVEEGETG